MNKEQYDRWKDFALRMVPITVSSRKRSPSRADVVENIEFLFECRFDSEWERIVSWDYTRKGDGEFEQRPMCPGDHVSDCAEHFIPNYWSLRTERQFEKAETRYIDPVSICVRAGLDVAVAPSAGVCGFSAGDIRKMYPEGVPSWVQEFFAPPAEKVALHPTNVQGVFAIENKGIDVRTFSELPDSEAVWL